MASFLEMPNEFHSKDPKQRPPKALFGVHAQVSCFINNAIHNHFASKTGLSSNKRIPLGKPKGRLEEKGVRRAAAPHPLIGAKVDAPGCPKEDW